MRSACFGYDAAGSFRLIVSLDHPTACGSRDVQFALGVEELADDGPLIEVRRPQARFPERELPIYKASAIGLLTRRELNVGGEG